MAPRKNAALAEYDYKVVSVEKTEPPEGVDGGSWYKYIVGRGDSSLVGSRRGTLKQVTEHAQTLVNDLNARSGRKGKSVWAPKQQKPA
jgi:hypothetical protein